mgnify:CR=1 FL=1
MIPRFSAEHINGTETIRSLLLIILSGQVASACAYLERILFSSSAVWDLMQVSTSVMTHYIFTQNSDPSQTLGERLKEELKDDILQYAFEYGIYKVQASGFFRWFYQAARFESQDFYEGLDSRVEVLLQHVDECIENHGEDIVLQ